MENILIFSEIQIKKINKEALAEKHNVSGAYVGQVLRGEKGKGKLAKAIRLDARNLLGILGDPVMDIEVVDAEILSA